MGGGAGPGVLLGHGNDPCPRRILLYVKDCIPKMIIVESTPVKAFLPEVTTESIFDVEISSITAMEVMHKAGKTLFRFRDGDEMNVIVH